MKRNCLLIFSLNFLAPACCWLLTNDVDVVKVRHLTDSRYRRILSSGGLDDELQLRVQHAGKETLLELKRNNKINENAPVYKFKNINGTLALQREEGAETDKVFLLLQSTNGESVKLNSGNLDTIIKSNELVFVNFYADWCRFSQILKPVFDDAAKKVKEQFPVGKVEFAKVDCDAESGIAANYRITKYPTLKLFRNGHMIKKEYRGQRSVDSMVDFIKEQLRDPVIDHKKLDELDELDAKKRHMIGFFDNEHTENYKTFVRVAGHLRDNCQFHAAFGAVAEPERTTGDRLIYRPPNTVKEDVVYAGAINVFDQLLTWIYERCVPLVREITFENAEELTEEGLPFLILFHKLDDQAIVKEFEAGVQRELLHEKNIFPKSDLMVLSIFLSLWRSWEVKQCFFTVVNNPGVADRIVPSNQRFE